MSDEEGIASSIGQVAAQWFGLGRDHSGTQMLAAAATAFLTQAAGIWAYGKWREWHLYSAFFREPGQGLLGFRRPEAAEVSPHADVPRTLWQDTVRDMLVEGSCAYLVAGSLGCGKSWLLQHAVQQLRVDGEAVAYVDVRPNSTRAEFVVQLADVMNFRFQQPTSWITSLMEWFFEQQVSTDDSAERPAAMELSDWHRLTLAIEHAAAAVERKRGRVATLVIDNLQNILVEKEGGDTEVQKKNDDFVHTVLDWATWCADKEELRVVVALPSTMRTKRLLEQNPRAQAALQVLEIPLLDKGEVDKYLEGCLPKPDDQEWRRAVLLTSIVESPLWAKKMWDMCTLLGRSWKEIDANFHAEGTRILRQYGLRNFDPSPDAEEDRRKARMWRLLIKLLDEHAGTKRQGVRPHTKRLLGERAQRDIDALLDAAVLSSRLVTGEIRMRSPPLRYVVRQMAGESGSVVRDAINRALERLDPGGGNVLAAEDLMDHLPEVETGTVGITPDYSNITMARIDRPMLYGSVRSIDADAVPSDGTTTEPSRSRPTHPPPAPGGVSYRGARRGGPLSTPAVQTPLSGDALALSGTSSSGPPRMRRPAEPCTGGFSRGPSPSDSLESSPTSPHGGNSHQPGGRQTPRGASPMDGFALPGPSESPGR
eukprot:TRINITY_DN14881_c0_g1_i1.p1 TRINITY_DN14881_c0_g1~~TRINITY_DN14881_c0_g1_i1.p1  ORF type:complete len:652 (+),score=173.39 TRINITY_DN14881_c0_g1_i1:100-2055(+)